MTRHHKNEHCVTCGKNVASSSFKSLYERAQPPAYCDKTHGDSCCAYDVCFTYPNRSYYLFPLHLGSWPDRQGDTAFVPPRCPRKKPQLCRACAVTAEAVHSSLSNTPSQPSQQAGRSPLMHQHTQQVAMEQAVGNQAPAAIPAVGDHRPSGSALTPTAAPPAGASVAQSSAGASVQSPLPSPILTWGVRRSRTAGLLALTVANPANTASAILNMSWPAGWSRRPGVPIAETRSAGISSGSCGTAPTDAAAGIGSGGGAALDAATASGNDGGSGVPPDTAAGGGGASGDGAALNVVAASGNDGGSGVPPDAAAGWCRAQWQQLWRCRRSCSAGRPWGPCRASFSATFSAQPSGWPTSS